MFVGHSLRLLRMLPKWLALSSSTRSFPAVCHRAVDGWRGTRWDAETTTGAAPDVKPNTPWGRYRYKYFGKNTSPMRKCSPVIKDSRLGTDLKVYDSPCSPHRWSPHRMYPHPVVVCADVNASQIGYGQAYYFHLRMLRYRRHVRVRRTEVLIHDRSPQEQRPLSQRPICSLTVGYARKLSVYSQLCTTSASGGVYIAGRGIDKVVLVLDIWVRGCGIR